MGSFFSFFHFFTGRGFGRGGPAFNRPNFQRGRGFYQRGGGQNWRMGFAREHDLDIQYPPFQRREMFGRGYFMNLLILLCLIHSFCECM